MTHETGDPRRIVSDWLSAFAMNEGLPDLRLDERGLLGLLVDESLHIEVEVPAQAPLVYLRAALVDLPQHDRERTCLRLLERNLVFENTGGAAFAIDTLRNQICLSLSQPMARLDAVDFGNLLGGFISTARTCAQQLQAELDGGLSNERQPDAAHAMLVRA